MVANNANQASNEPYLTITAKDWTEAKAMLSALGDEWIFRGQRDASRDLKTTLERQIIKRVKEANSNYTGLGLYSIELMQLRSFKRGYHLYPSPGRQPDSTLNWWAEMQHYGTATRLLDFSWSPYVASYFAYENGAREVDRAIWALNGHHYQQRVNNFLQKYFPDEIDRSKLNNSEVWDDPEFVDRFLMEAETRKLRTVITLTTNRMNVRMTAQQGLFVMPSSLDVSFMDHLRAILLEESTKSLIKIILPKKCRYEALMDLKRMNITRASLFPGLEGYAQSHVAQAELNLNDSRAEVREQQAKQRKKFGLPE